MQKAFSASAKTRTVQINLQNRGLPHSVRNDTRRVIIAVGFNQRIMQKAFSASAKTKRYRFA